MSNATVVVVANTLKTLSLFNHAISYTTVVSCIASFLAVGGSIGGGGMQVATFLLFFDFDVSSATTLSRTVVFAVVLSTYFYSWRAKNPNIIYRPAIDYDIALLMGPTSVLGSVYGTLINTVFSDYIIFICMILVLLFSIYKTVEKGLQARKKELAAREKAEQDRTEKELEETNPKGDKVLQVDEEPKKGENSERIQYFLDLESRQFPLDRYFLVLATITGIALSSIFSGGKTKSIIGVNCGSWSYHFILFGCTFIYLWGISIYVAWEVYRKEQEKVEIGFPFHESDMKWTVYKLFMFPVMAFVVGLCAGAFGIGGGLIQGPLMLALGVAPSVMSVTSLFVVLMNTCATLIQAFSTSTLPWDWAGWFIGWGIMGAFFGRGVLERTVRAYKMQSVIVFFLAILIVITMGALVYSFSRRITDGTATWSFKPLCTAIANTTNTTQVNVTQINVTTIN